MRATILRLMERALSSRAFWAFLGGLALGVALTGGAPAKRPGEALPAPQKGPSSEAWLASLEQELGK